MSSSSHNHAVESLSVYAQVEAWHLQNKQLLEKLCPSSQRDGSDAGEDRATAAFSFAECGLSLGILSIDSPLSGVEAAMRFHGLQTLRFGLPKQCG